jgi:hypothetical protein
LKVPIFVSLLLRELHFYFPEENKEKLIRWIHRLVDPLPGKDFQVKRNRYLFMICCSLMTENSSQFLTSTAAHSKANKKKKVRVIRATDDKQMIADTNGIPTLTLALDINEIAIETAHSEWEKLKCWENRLKVMNDVEEIGLNSNARNVKKKNVQKCSIHINDCPKEEVQKKIGQSLDNKFKFLLYIAETYQNVTTCEKERTNMWLHALSKIGENACVEMKGIRNDYIMLMIGYLMNNELKGPFEDLPSSCLQPLTQAIATYISKRKNEQHKTDQTRVPLNPASETIEAFMNHVPKIVEGAFALLSINGSMFNQ